MKNKVVTPFSYVPFENNPENSHEFPSVAIPDDAFTIEELLERHRAGVLTDLTNTAIYSDDADLDDIDQEKLMREDIDVRVEFAQEGKRELDRLRKRKADEDQKEAERLHNERIEKEVEDRIKKRGEKPAQ